MPEVVNRMMGLTLSAKYHGHTWIQKLFSGGGGPPSDQGWPNKFYHCKNSYFGKSRGGGLNPLSPPLDPPMMVKRPVLITFHEFDSTPQPLYNTIVGVQANIRVNYPNRVITRVKCIVI